MCQYVEGQPCHICGDGANAELIVICFQCRKSREHIYCMRPNLDKFPAEWHCEACRGDTLVHQEACHSDSPRRCHEEEVKSPSEREQNSAIGNECSEIPDVSKKIGSPSGKPAARLLSRDFVPNKVDKGKVKYLPVEHIYALSSGAKWKQPSLGGSSSQKGSFGNNRRLISKTPPARVFATKRYSYEKDHGHSSPGHAKSLQKQVAKPSQQLQELNLQVRLAHKSSATGNSTSQTVLTTRGKRATNDEARHSPLEHTVPVVNGVKEKVEHEKTLLPLDKHAGKMDSILSKDCARKEEHVNVIACHQDARSEEENLPNPPAVNALWKGSFEIHKSLEIYGGFQAYPPAILSRKACSIASKMSKVLPFTLQPRSDVWPKTFRTDFPSAYDIALYFLADDFDREKYNGLVERMEKHDLSLKSQSQWDGVELLIFTSRELPAESQSECSNFVLFHAKTHVAWSSSKKTGDPAARRHYTDSYATLFEF
ncbi:hypothetical protein IFM89_008132 [Coptis chinensis]|uniref:Zinc finger PHD-type domain-containing protein n=1 Tax=Coptis chinensis TaxID=261450 RepID=A0A835IVK1_9MAGN|nr:hypothetical protein IFM89_008132 [Coptis chinensis]